MLNNTLRLKHLKTIISYFTPVVNLSCNILLSCCFNQNQVRIKYQPDSRILPDVLKHEINQFWHREVTQTSKSSFLFNGELCRLDGWEINDKKLTLLLGTTNYKELFYSNRFTHEIMTRFDYKHLSAALGISAVLVSNDEHIGLIKRSETVGEDPGKLDIIGGHIHPVEHAVSGIPDPFFAIKAEIAEELNLAITDYDVIECIGLVETKTTKKPELIFQVKSQLTSAEIKQLGANNDSFEISEILFIENNKDSVINFIRKKLDQFSASAIGSLWIYSQTLN